ncbi:MAG: DNA-directed RNA polymerase subunit beta [Candidatus Gottesmanbacteria bacterium GW2011_GWA2_41_12]|uniref:DNA-directed RNA polymerase subunit beta n=2 Tax=Candidatus Gottesmaniibacteriota TaxID=1752720 RepID=A0A0G0ULW8_9BACT|nr:MAG: DNA-directed RNA polymerase subunit beta [Candidatus Gottesmanbacteria bacterium GW2011_GWC2_39_8]KKR88526.1 MAG: DNA-directed RNA polymerase subunit beta [Candidatus Gottesmanbacteria bacterium GW2011_GWA2_41_12]
MSKDNINNSQPNNNRISWGGKYLNLPELNLTHVQKESYQWLIDIGIKELLEEITPIDDFTGKNWSLYFNKHSLDKPRLNPEECIAKGLTYDVPLKVEATLVNKQTGRSVTQEVFLGDIPAMTENGTFIINGVERCIVNQIVRSPGAYFTSDVDPVTGRILYAGEIRPLFGSWLDFNISRNDVITVRIDRRRKFAATTLLRAIGVVTDEEIIKAFSEVDTDKDHPYIGSTIAKDPTRTKEEALLEIYRKMRPGEPVVLDNAEDLLKNLFFETRRYSLGSVGRYKINKRLGLNIPNEKANWILTKDDVVGIIKSLIDITKKKGNPDDIDHLGNRRIRRVGELVASSSFRVGFLRLERAVKERMSLAGTQIDITPSQIVNARPIIAAINDFFRTSQLSTILDQTNPLAEIDNLRRITVMGVGGISRERASFSIRDINASQYSRICPVRSPEGPNIGLVTYMALYTRVNEYGFLEAPYRRVVKEKNKMRVTNEVVYITADDEQNHYVTHADLNIDKNGYILDERIPLRYKNEFLEGETNLVEYIDVVPRQVVGLSASLIPFLAHDEANRALMGTHMQCQAVPLIKPAAPIVGTGMEIVVPEAMKRTVKSPEDGKIIYVDSLRVELKGKSGKVYNFDLTKFKRTAQNTSFSQKPIVTVGDKVVKDQMIIDGPATDNGELALGQNLLIAYASFEGLGYEDAIVISDRLVREDALTSINIEEYETEVVDTKLGVEETTRDIPNVGEEALANLDEEGIVIVGAEVGPNDILVGKIAPKGETELTAEERLLRAIFGEKAREVRDTSLRVPHGERGVVIEIKVLDREKGDELEPGTVKKIIVKVAQIRKVVVGDKLAGRHGNKGVISRIVPACDMPFLEDGTPIDIIISPLSVLSRMNLGQLLEAHLGWAAQKGNFKVAVPVFEGVLEDKIVEELKKQGLPAHGKAILRDGKSGEPIKEPVVVGVAYMMKLIHMVEDKTHARSTGPYSLVTQQPLGGKAQMGGQRLGEMEVWALEAHKAAHVLQEMLTIKSDDVVGRARAFEAIVKGNDIPASTIPESFKVLVKELQSLGLNVVPTGAVTASTKAVTIEEQVEEVKKEEEAKEFAEIAGEETVADKNEMKVEES